MDELIEEAKDFDSKLKTMGLNISVKDLLKEDDRDDDDAKLARASRMADEEHGAGHSHIRQIGEDVKTDTSHTTTEKTKIGIVKINTKKLDYIPVQSKLVPFSDRQFNPHFVIPKAPNHRLEMRKTLEEVKLDSMDLYDMIIELGFLRKDTQREGNSLNRTVPKAVVSEALRSLYKGRLLIGSKQHSTLDI